MSFARRTRQEPPTVLVVGTRDRSSSLVERLESALESYSVVSVADGSGVEDAIDRDDGRVACVVVPAALEGGSGTEIAASIAARQRAPPVILVPEAVDDEVALATTRGVTSIVPVDHLDRLGEAVTDAAERYLDHLGHELQLEAVETLFGEIEDVFQIKDAGGRYLRLHSNAEWPAEADALGRTDRDLHDDQFDLNERYYEEDQRVLSTGEPILGEVTGYGGAEDEDPLFWLETTKVPLRNDAGDVIGLVGHVRDVTERIRHRRELEEKTRRLDRFAAYVSHDLQNPLSIATGYLDLAREGDEEALDAVDDAIDRMQELIDDIELLARGEQNLLAAGSAEDLVATRQRVAEMASNVWGVLSTEEATLELDLPTDTVVYASEEEFRSLLENLLKNARDHGGDDITVRVGATWDGIYVEDDGPGIPEEDREKVFEQGYSTAKGGTGTGLAIVSEVASAHGWTLEVAEGSDGGARFKIGNCLTVTDPAVEPTLGESLELSEAADVGDPGVPGHSSYDADAETWTLSGSGEDIWAGENDFRFVHTELDGDCRLQARLVEMDEPYEYSKAGVMLRDDLQEDSVHGYVGFSPELIEVLWCPEAAAQTTSQQLQNEDGGYEWVRIERQGKRVTTSVSEDGEEWFAIDQRTLSMTDPIHAGLVVTSAVHRESCEAIFDNVSVRRLSEE